MRRRSLGGSRAIVTGASGGIGRELALELARRGCRLLVTARRVERLAAVRDKVEAGGGQAIVIAGDITAPETRRKIVAAAESAWGGIDILINNAGVGAVGKFESASPERLRRIMEVNFFAAVELTRELLPLLHRGNRPIIANVSSILGHRAVPNKSEYCASKFALHGFSDALRAELSRDGIDVLLISPSTTDSEFSEHVLEVQGSYKRHWHAMHPSTVARASVRAIARGRHEVILPLSGRMFVWLDRLCPPLADWLIAKLG